MCNLCARAEKISMICVQKLREHSIPIGCSLFFVMQNKLNTENLKFPILNKISSISTTFQNLVNDLSEKGYVLNRVTP